MIEFRFERVEKNDPRMEELFRLRYQVYCNECEFESPEDHPGGLETDEYDEHSRHFCAIAFDPERPAEPPRIIGTVRIILAFSEGLPQNRLPIEEHCPFWEEEVRRLERFRKEGVPFAEISRLAISKDFRRREIDKAIYSQTEFDFKEARRLHAERRKFEGQIVLGLYQCIYQQSLQDRLVYWYGVMVKGLSGLLERWGVFWEKIGEPVEYHGLRIPYIADIKKNAAGWEKLNPPLLQPPEGWK